MLESSAPPSDKNRPTLSVVFAKLLTLFTALLICGCASAGRNFDSRKVAEIKKGETTEADLLHMFGKPAQRGMNSETGVTLTWIYTEATVKGATFIPIVGAFAGGMDTRNKMLTITLSKNGTVASYNYSGGAIGSTGTANTSDEKFENAEPVKPARSPKDGGK